MKEGKHFGSCRLDSFFSTAAYEADLNKNKATINRLLSSISDPKILELLKEEARIDEIFFTQHIYADGDVRGQYSSEKRKIDIQLLLSPGLDFALPANEPTLTVSQRASTEDEALRRTLIHEVAHHLQQFIYLQSGLAEELYERWKDAKASDVSVSPYARSHPGEYWAETMTAHFTDEKASALDPQGIALIERIFTLIQPEKSTS